MVQNKTALPHNHHIDILRILACLFVISIHTKVANFEGDVIQKQALFINCIVGDAVAIFFSITGFLWYRSKKKFTQLLGSFIKKIAIPTLCAGIISQILFGWLRNSSWSFTANSFSAPNFSTLINGILQNKPATWNNLCGIYWYVFDYARLCLWFPVISFISRHKGIKIINAVVIYIFAVLLIENTLLILNTAGIQYNLYTYKPINVQLGMVLLGCIMCEYIDTISKKIKTPIAILFYLSTIIIRFLLQYFLYSVEPSKTTFLRYDCSFSFLTVFSLYILAWKINIPAQGRLSRVTKYISGHTFTIYLIHYMIVRKLISVHITDSISRFVKNAFPRFWATVYDGLIVLFVFFLSLALSILIKFLCRKLQTLVKIPIKRMVQPPSIK